MRAKLFFIAVITLICIIGISCSKEKGPKGDQGEKGEQGQKGNANVMANTFTLSAIDWSVGCSNTCYSASLPGPSLTNSYIVDNSMVMVYIQSGTSWVALPFTINDIETYFTYDIGTISLKVRSASGNTSLSNPGTIVCKTVVIPPGMIKKPSTVVDYSQVATLYNIE